MKIFKWFFILYLSFYIRDPSTLRHNIWRQMSTVTEVTSTVSESVWRNSNFILMYHNGRGWRKEEGGETDKTDSTSTHGKKRLTHPVDVSCRRAWCAQRYTDSRRSVSALCPAQFTMGNEISYLASEALLATRSCPADKPGGLQHADVFSFLFSGRLAAKRSQDVPNRSSPNF